MGSGDTPQLAALVSHCPPVGCLPVCPHASLLQLVFSSSCTVYGNPQYVPIDEKHPRKAVSPYGRTKLMIEEIFE